MWNERYTQTLTSGMVLLKRFISHEDQALLVSSVNKLGIGTGGFYKHKNEDPLRPYMMCLNRNWEPGTGFKNPRRSDGSVLPPISASIEAVASNAVSYAQNHIKRLLGQFNMVWIPCIHTLHPLGLWEVLGLGRAA
ncbi:hypothetical protein M8C21_003873 [Ambrosia artemisiifolia]|uniref:Uncharacterized protein n=1 Tax=Ambrosia artemisiifolia TaxID=4212 RepID=A0AAD5D3A5_AMBAR|nr:hypothetical protein M8C21_003873 [Ambrosia artemisiifolia]